MQSTGNICRKNLMEDNPGAAHRNIMTKHKYISMIKIREIPKPSLIFQCSAPNKPFVYWFSAKTNIMG